MGFNFSAVFRFQVVLHCPGTIENHRSKAICDVATHASVHTHPLKGLHPAECSECFNACRSS